MDHINVIYNHITMVNVFDIKLKLFKNIIKHFFSKFVNISGEGRLNNQNLGTSL